MGILATLTGLRLLRFILRVVTTVILVVVIYLGVTAVQVWLTGRRYEARHADAIVVMGAAQYNGVASPDLAARLDEALILWRQGDATEIVVTGSKEPGDHYTEADASDRYLVARGVPGRDIFEVGGRDSWQNLADAATVLTAHHARSILMTTDPFHEDRCLAIASSLGFVAYPTPTRTSPIKGVSTIPYYAKETVGVALGRIIGFDRLDSLHVSLGQVGQVGGVGEVGVVGVVGEVGGVRR